MDTTDEPTVAIRVPGSPLDGRYELIRQIGRGGMGEVYEARDLRLGRTVAIKLLNEAPAADAERFAAEARTLASFAHPHLVRLHDVGEEGNRPYLVLELVEGNTLAEQLRAGPLPEPEAARVGRSVASALAYVHGRGVVHRDVKPGNILVGKDGWIWLTDFGIARLVDSTGMTATGTALGTPAYLAPEQVEAKPLTGAVDVYALGLVLLEALSGRRAFEGTRAEVTAARLQRPPVLPDDLDSGWRQLLEAMTAREPERRPGAGEVAAQLGGETTARFEPTGAFETAPTSLLAPTLAEPTEVAPAEPRPGRRWRLLALALLVALGVGLALGALLGGGSPSRGPGTQLAASTTTTSPTTSTTTTTTTTLPPTTVAPTPASAAGNLITAIEGDAVAGTLDPDAARKLVTEIEPLALAGLGGGPDAQGGYDHLVADFDQDVANGLVSSSAVGPLQSSIDALGSALGVSVTPSSVPTATVPPAGPLRHGKGHGKDHGD